MTRSSLSLSGSQEEKAKSLDNMRENNNIQQRHVLLHGPGVFAPFLAYPARSSAVFIFIVFLFVGLFISSRLLHFNEEVTSLTKKSVPSTDVIPDNTTKSPNDKKPSTKIQIPLNCNAFNRTKTCPTDHPSTVTVDPDPPSPPTCPSFFRWIHEDLRPWARTGISRDTIERAKTTANFRLVIVKGRAYVETFVKGFQTRDVFTLWGILQLLRRYPGKLPDLEMMFDCVDWPVIRAVDYSGPNASTPPPLFRYCGNDDTLDIVFPDWSFWGWAETNIKPWEHILSDLAEGNKRTKWIDREPYAYWKGNPDVAETRQNLMKCNVSEKLDWNARLYSQNWVEESQQGYKLSDLANQCIHRYKIYIEGSAWSVSQKYILACDSVTLLVNPHYYDFFTRGLEPIHHYWPIKEDDKCRSIKFAVDWGNSHKREAQAIGEAGSKFIQEELKMDYVYDYMFHLLNEYSKLLTFKPTIPKNATEVCSEAMACLADGLEKKFEMESLVKGPADTSPCTMPPPFDPPSLRSILKRKKSGIEQVELWEKNYRNNQGS